MLAEVLLAVGVFTVVIILLVAILNIANATLVSQGPFKISINNGKKELSAGAGHTALTALNEAGIFLPAACGGGGSCGMCKCKIPEGGGDVLPTEEGFLSRSEKKQKVRLGCQVKVKNDMNIEVADAIFGIKMYTVKVRSNESVSAFMKDLILEVPEEFKYEAGHYIQIHVPEYKDLRFKTDIDIPEEYHDVWDRYKAWGMVAYNEEETARGYSIASYPAEKGIVMIRVRLATPPDEPGIPPGIGSSYIFGLKPGDEVVMSGPYGDEFFVEKTDREMCFIASGAGLGPIRGHVFHQLYQEKTNRKMTFWYGARSVKESVWCDNYPQMEKDYPNFKHYTTLSRPRPEDNWTGFKGHVHKVVLKEYLDNHPDPGNVEYYLCGPTNMMNSTLEMLDSLGVENEMIKYDAF